MKFLKKKKLTVMIAAGLAGVSLGSIGFAGWVINAQTEANPNVNVTFGAVSDNSYEAKLDENASKLKLAFDSNKAIGTNGMTGEADKEILDVTIKFKIQKTNSTNTPGSTIFNAGLKSFKVTYSNYDLLNNLITTGGEDSMNLINSPVDFSEQTISLEDKNSSSNVNDTTKKTFFICTVGHDTVNGINVTMQYHFAWGEIFGRANPMECAVAKNQTKGLRKLSELTAGKTVILGIKITPVFTAA